MANGDAPAPPRPLPASNPLTAPFWAAAKQRRLAVQHCAGCSRLIWYPREICPGCWTMDGIEWKELSGKGRLHTFTVIRQAADPYFQQRVPYVYGVVELDEGVRMISGIRCPVEDAACGMPVEAVFEDLDEDWTIVQFRPAAG